MVIEATHTETNHHGESEPPVSFSTRSFNETPTVVFHTKLGVDPGCVDYYNPSPIDRSGVTFIFPAATRHLNQPKKNGTAFPSPYTSCRTMNDGMLDVRMAFSRLADPSNATFTRVSTAPVVSRGMGSRSPSTGLFNVAGSDWDAGMVFMATGIVELESEPWHMSMYYFGGQVRCMFSSSVHRAIYFRIDPPLQSLLFVHQIPTIVTVTLEERGLKWCEGRRGYLAVSDPSPPSETTR
jgi:hypothetical protein